MYKKPCVVACPTPATPPLQESTEVCQTLLITRASVPPLIMRLAGGTTEWSAGPGTRRKVTGPSCPRRRRGHRVVSQPLRCRQQSRNNNPTITMSAMIVPIRCGVGQQAVMTICTTVSSAWHAVVFWKLSSFPLSERACAMLRSLRKAAAAFLLITHRSSAGSASTSDTYARMTALLLGAWPPPAARLERHQPVGLPVRHTSCGGVKGDKASSMYTYGKYGGRAVMVPHVLPPKCRAECH